MNSFLASLIVLCLGTFLLKRDCARWRRIVSSVIVGALAFFLMQGAGAHKCDEGTPPFLFLLLIVVPVVIIPWINWLNPWVMRGLISIITTFGLIWASDLARSYHGDTITGNPDYSSGTFWHTPITGQYPREPNKHR